VFDRSQNAREQELNMRQSAREIGRLDVQDGAREIVELPSSVTPRILIADDDPSIVRLLADHCARMGFDVDTASNGIQALLKASRTEPDTLVIDVNMPEVDGLSVCARLLDPGEDAGKRNCDDRQQESRNAQEMRRLWRVLHAQGAEFLGRAGRRTG
jgi:PleD family two-component response regulator